MNGFLSEATYRTLMRVLEALGLLAILLRAALRRRQAAARKRRGSVSRETGGE